MRGRSQIGDGGERESKTGARGSKTGYGDKRRGARQKYGGERDEPDRGWRGPWRSAGTVGQEGYITNKRYSTSTSELLLLHKILNNPINDSVPKIR